MGEDIPVIHWRKSDIYLQNDYRTYQYHPSERLQHVETLIPERADVLRRRRHAHHASNNERLTRAMARVTVFPTALRLARQLATSDRHLASALSLAHEHDLLRASFSARRLARKDSLELTVGAVRDALLSDLPVKGGPQPQPQEHEGSDASSASSSGQPIPNPPIPGHPAPSLGEIFSRVNSFAKSHGFGIIKANGVVRSGRRSRCVLQCDRYGAPRPGTGAGLRKRKSRKSGCRWKIAAESLPENNFEWTLRRFPDVATYQHNHGASTDAAAHPVHRRLTSPVKAAVQSSSRRIGIRARDIGGIIRDQFPDSVYTQKDIYNARAQISREQLGGYGSTAALIKLFDEKEIPYIVKWAGDDPNRLVGLVWTFPYCLRMWRRFSEVISFDNTYSTNRFKLPLFQVTGQTCLGTVFNAAFGLIDNERFEGFQFLAGGVRKLLDGYSVRPPDVVITDFDNQMKKALGHAFPDAQQQLCIHHINSNVLLQSKRRWVSSTGNSSTGEEDSLYEPEVTLEQRGRHAAGISDKRDERTAEGNASEPIPHDYHGVLMLWKQVVFAETEEDHEKAWEYLCQEFRDQRAILTYLYATYLPMRAQWARCFIKKYRNFGIRVTSGTEASNNNVKSYLLNGMSHLYRLVEAIQGMLEDQEREFRQACAQDEVLVAREHAGPGSEYLGGPAQAVSK